MKPTCLLLVAVGPFWAHVGLQGPIFGHFLAVMWPPTAAKRELGVQTHGDRVALRRGTLFLRLGSFWGHLGAFWAVLAPLGPISASRGPFLAIFSLNVAANRRHPGVGGPNLVGRSALARGPFRPSLGPRAIGVPKILNEAHLLVACCCWPLLGPFRPPRAHFGPFLAIMWPPTGTTRELGAQTWWV